MQNEVKQVKQQNIQSMLNQSLPVSQNVQTKARSNSTKLQQNIDNNNFHNSSKINNNNHNNNINSQDGIISQSNQLKKQIDYQGNNGSTPSIQQIQINNLQNNIINSPTQARQQQQQQQQQQLQNYGQGTQKESNQNTTNGGNNGIGLYTPFLASNQSPNNSNNNTNTTNQNQHYSLIQFNITQNLKNQKGRAYQTSSQSQSQQGYFQSQQQQQQQMQQSKKNDLQYMNQQQLNSNNGNVSHGQQNIKNKANLVIQDTNNIVGINGPKIFSPLSQQNQQNNNNISSQNTSQYQMFISNTNNINNNQSISQNQHNESNQSQLTASGATIMNMMNINSGLSTQTNKYINDNTNQPFQKQFHLLSNPSLAAQLQIQQNKLNHQGQSLGSKVAKAQSTIISKKSFAADKSTIASSSSQNNNNNNQSSQSNMLQNQDKLNLQNGQNNNLISPSTSSNGQYNNQIGNQGKQQSQQQGSNNNNHHHHHHHHHQHQKSSITSSNIQEMLGNNIKQNNLSSYQTNLNNNNNVLNNNNNQNPLAQQLATKIQSINKNSGKIQQNSYVNKSTNESSSIQNNQLIQTPSEKHYQSNANNVINPISSIENYKTTIEAYKRMVENLNKQLELQPTLNNNNHKNIIKPSPKVQSNGNDIVLEQQSQQQQSDLLENGQQIYSLTQLNNYIDNQEDFLDNIGQKSSSLSGIRMNDTKQSNNLISNNNNNNKNSQSNQINLTNTLNNNSYYNNNNNNNFNQNNTNNNNENNSNIANNNNNNINNTNNQNVQNSNYGNLQNNINNINNNQNNIGITNNLKKSFAEINEVRAPSVRQSDQEEKHSSSTQIIQQSQSQTQSNTNTNVQNNNNNNGLNYPTTMTGNIYGNYKQQNQINSPHLLDNNNSKQQSQVETPSNSSQSHLKSSKLGNLLKFQFKETDQQSINHNGISLSSVGGVAKKKKSDIIGGIVPNIAAQSNLRRTPSNSVTQNPLLFGQTQQQQQQSSSSQANVNIFNSNSPPHPHTSKGIIDKNQQQMSMTAPQQHSFLLNLNKTKQIMSANSQNTPITAIESGSGKNTISSSHNQQQQQQINSAKLENTNYSNQRSSGTQFHQNSQSFAGNLETSHFRPSSSTLSASKLKHQNIMTPSKSFSQIFPPPLENSKVSSMRSLYWIVNTPSTFVKAFLLDTKYYNDYKQSLNNYVDFVTNIKHPYIFEESSDKDQTKKTKGHKVSSILAGLQLSQENDSMKNIRNITDNNISQKNFLKWKEDMEFKVSQLNSKQNGNNNISNHKVQNNNKTSQIKSNQINQSTQNKSSSTSQQQYQMSQNQQQIQQIQ